MSFEASELSVLIDGYSATFIRTQEYYIPAVTT